MENEIEILNQERVIESREIAEMLEVKHWEVLRKLEGTNDGKSKGIIRVLDDNNIVVADYFIKSTYRDFETILLWFQNK